VFALQVTIQAGTTGPSIGTLAGPLLWVVASFVLAWIRAPVEALGALHAIRSGESRLTFAFAIFCIRHGSPVLARCHVASFTAVPLVVPGASAFARHHVDFTTLARRHRGPDAVGVELRFRFQRFSKLFSKSSLWGSHRTAKRAKRRHRSTDNAHRHPDSSGGRRHLSPRSTSGSTWPATVERYPAARPQHCKAHLDREKSGLICGGPARLRQTLINTPRDLSWLGSPTAGIGSPRRANNRAAGRSILGSEKMGEKSNLRSPARRQHGDVRHRVTMTLQHGKQAESVSHGMALCRRGTPKSPPLPRRTPRSPFTPT